MSQIECCWRAAAAETALYVDECRVDPRRRQEYIGVFRWLDENTPGSYGLLYMREDDVRPDADISNFRVWRLDRGELREMDDPFFSTVPTTAEPRDGGRVV